MTARLLRLPAVAAVVAAAISMGVVLPSRADTPVEWTRQSTSNANIDQIGQYIQGPSGLIWVPIEQVNKTTGAITELGSFATGVSATLTTAKLNAQIAFDIAAGKGTTKLQPDGIYHLAAIPGASADGSAAALLVRNAFNYTLDCQGSTLLLDGTDKAAYGHIIRAEYDFRFRLKNCPNIDYTNVPFLQATATSIGSSSVTFTANADYLLENGMPSWTSVQRVSRYDPANPAKTWLGTNLEFGVHATASQDNRAVTISGTTLTVDYSADMTAKSGIVVGASYLLENEAYGPNDGTGHTVNALSLFNVNGVTVEDTVVYANAGEAFQGFNASNPSFVRSGCRVKPGSTRIQSTNADCINIAHSRGLFSFDLGWVEGTQDDGINVYSNMSPIASIGSTTQITVGSTPGIGIAVSTWAVGDTIEFLDSTGRLLGTAQLSAISGATLSFGSAIPSGINASTCTSLLICTISDQTDAPSLYKVTGSLFNRIRGRALTGNAEGFSILGNAFADLPANGAVEFNSIYTYFSQGPVPQNGTISDNSFDRINTIGDDPGVITLYRFSTDGSHLALGGSGTGGNWTVSNNRFADTRNSDIFATSLDGFHAWGNSNTRYGANYDTNGGFPLYLMGQAAIGLVNVTSGRVDADNQYLPATDLLRAAAVVAPDSAGNAGAQSVAFHTADKLVGVIVGDGSTQTIPSDATDYIINAAPGVTSLSSLTLRFNLHPIEDQMLRITSNVPIGTLTCVANSAQIIDACPSSLAQHVTQAWTYYNPGADFIKR